MEEIMTLLKLITASIFVMGIELVIFLLILYLYK